MKNYIEYNIEMWRYNNKGKVLEQLFATLGNGIELTNKGYLGSEPTDELIDLSKVEPLEHIYPWSKNTDYQPFRKYTGCRNTQFKEVAQYFIATAVAKATTTEE